MANECSNNAFPFGANSNNSNNILYSSQREIKAVVRWHNEEHISIILCHETRTYTLLDIRSLSLNLHRQYHVDTISCTDDFMQS